MTPNERVVDFRTVFGDEIKEEIVPRRREAGLLTTESDDDAKKAQQNLVGLALSGGGIRAAAFGLGVLQALYQRRLMKYVDYLSTVSGGGFAGSLFSSLVNHPEGSVVWKRSQIVQPPGSDKPNGQGQCDKSLYSIEQGEGGKQPTLIRNISTSGSVLRRPVWFASAYFFGLLLTNLVAVSGLLAAAALCAYLFQLLMSPDAVTFINALGFNGDVAVAFFPAFVILLLWAFCMILGNAVQALEFLLPVARVLFVVLVAAIAMATVVLIGTGNIDLTKMSESFGLSINNTLISGPSSGGVVSVLLLAVALLPYLRLRELVRSGVRPRGYKDRWIFGIASRALLYGVPLLLFGWFAREDISGFVNRREIVFGDRTFSKSNMLGRSHLGNNWSTFWQTVETSTIPKGQSNQEDPKLGWRLGLSATILPNGAFDLVTSASPPTNDAQLTQLRHKVNGWLWNIANAKPTNAERVGPLPQDKSEPASEQESPEGLARSEKPRSLPETDPIAKSHKQIKAMSGLGMLGPQRFGLRVTTDSLDPQMIASWPTDGEDMPERRAPLAASKTKPMEEASSNPQGSASPKSTNLANDDEQAERERTIIDVDQDSEVAIQEYDKRYMLEKWSLLLTLISKDNALAQQIQERRRSLARADAICNRLNYHFVSNPYIAIEMLKAKDEIQKQAPEVIDRLDRSAAGLLTQAGSSWSNPAFLSWQARKHRLLYYEQVGWPSEVTREVFLNALDEQETADGRGRYRHREFEAIEAGIREFNLACLEKFLYPKAFQPQSTIFSSVVLAADQSTRLEFFEWAALICVVSSLLVNLNFSSIHSYYQFLMSKVWIAERPGNGNRIPLVQLDNTSVGAPYHLLHGTVSLAPRGRFKPEFPRGGFLFSRRYCGSIDRGFLPTSELKNVDLPTAMSVSGAAVTPSAVENQLVWAVMFICNLRTGQWLAWPSKARSLVTDLLYRFACWKAGMAWHVALNACLPPSWRTMTFVYDGGLYENLGVEPLLARRCRLILAVDAAQDGESRFADFQLLVQRCRSRYGIAIEPVETEKLWIDQVRPAWTKAKESDPQKRTLQERFAEQGFILFKITYPSQNGLGLDPLDNNEGTLVYIKPTLTEKTSAAMLAYALNETEFPQDSTINQFYEPGQFGAYRSLGTAIGTDALDKLEKLAKGTTSLPGTEQIVWERPKECAAQDGESQRGFASVGAPDTEQVKDAVKDPEGNGIK